MLSPRPKTQPAELVATPFRLSARHMIAPIIFLNILIAVRTGLSIDSDPSDIFTLTGIFRIPVWNHFACARLVKFLAASKAKLKATFTLYLINRYVLIFYGIVAAWSRAKLDGLGFGAVTLAQKFFIPGLQGRAITDVLLNKRLWQVEIASFKRASDKYLVVRYIKFALDVQFPASSTDLLFAFKAVENWTLT